jgi:hypothetical protein
MTLREVLKSLHAVDDKYLDVQVLVSHTFGGYEGISHVSTLRVGNAVIHLAEPKEREAPPDLWEQQTGDVPAVKPDDLKSVWRLFGDVKARNSGAAGDAFTRAFVAPAQTHCPFGIEHPCWR